MRNRCAFVLNLRGSLARAEAEKLTQGALNDGHNTLSSERNAGPGFCRSEAGQTV